MSAFAVISPPEPVIEPPKPSKGDRRRERINALLPQATEATVPFMKAGFRNDYRARLLEIDPRCTYCGINLNATTATVDHAVPHSKGGPDSPWNLWLACKNCNGAKANRHVLEWLEDIYAAAVRMGFVKEDDEPAIAYAVGAWD